LVLVGESSVGKSSILRRFIDGDFSESQLMTIGVDFMFRKMVIEQLEVRLAIWDTAGNNCIRQGRRSSGRSREPTTEVPMQLSLYTISAAIGRSR
jgi:GTPase SAR1 family protein